MRRSTADEHEPDVSGVQAHPCREDGQDEEWGKAVEVRDLHQEVSAAFWDCEEGEEGCL
jgi:hypothetical protein